MTTNVIHSFAENQTIYNKLLDMCRRGDQKAQFKIYRLYYRAMFNTSLRIVKNATEAEDIMQESFLTAFEKIESWPGNTSFGVWLNNIVIDRSVSALRSKTSKDINGSELPGEFTERGLERTSR